VSHPLPLQDLEHVVSEVGSLWKILSGKRVLFTGASGFFGSWMLETFLHAGTTLDLPFRALALTRNTKRFSEHLPHIACDPRVEIMESDAATMPDPNGPVDYLVHSLVPDAGTPLTQKDLIFRSATQRLLDIALQKNSRAFLLCSTGAVYQPKNPPAPFSEDDPLVPLDAPLSYGLIRRRLEDQCRSALEKSGVALKIARGFAFVGPRLPLDANFAIGNFIRDSLAGGPIIVKGDGSPIRSYLYAADMAAWLWKILLQGTCGSAYNVGSSESTTISDLAKSIADLFATDVRIEHAPAPGNAPSCYLSRTDYELSPAKLVSMPESLDRTARWHQPSPSM